MTSDAPPPEVPDTGAASRQVVVVRDREASHVAGGYPEVTLDRLTHAPEGLFPGAPVTVAAASGGEVGWGLWDPMDGKVRIMDTSLESALDLDLVRQRVEAALALRQAAGLESFTDACRLINSEGDRLPGVRLDRYGEYLLLAVASAALQPVVSLLLSVLREQVSTRGILLKLAARRGGKGGTGQALLHGDLPPRRLLVKERDATFEVHLRGGVNTGLFTDLRLERARLRGQVKGLRVLHAFSYTGTMSAVLALGGAAHLTLVDTAPGMHAWAARNLRHSGCDPTTVRFLHQEVLAALDELTRAQERFDLVLLDAPTYSPALSGSRSLKQHLPPLVTHALPLLAPGGRLWVSTSSRRHRPATIEGWIQRGLAAAPGSLELSSRCPLPPDYPTLDCYPRSRYLLVVEGRSS